MSHAQSLWSDFPLSLQPQHIPSLLYLSQWDEQPHDPRTEGRFCRLAVQSLGTGYEPNATVEVIHILPPSRRAIVSSSGEDVTTTLVSSEVDERQSMGMLASPLLMQKRGKCSFASIYHSDRENLVSHSSHIPVTERLCGDVLAPSNDEQRCKTFTGILFRNSKDIRRASRNYGFS